MFNAQAHRFDGQADVDLIPSRGGDKELGYRIGLGVTVQPDATNIAGGLRLALAARAVTVSSDSMFLESWKYWSRSRIVDESAAAAGGPARRDG